MTTAPWIVTPRFQLHPLGPSDVTQRYLGWLHAAAGGAISAAREDYTLNELQAYLDIRKCRQDVLFLGIFERSGHQHIGNLKFEPIDARRREAVLGIFIGETEWRGVGVASEIIPLACDQLAETHGTVRVSLGVANSHEQAQIAYRKAGFVVQFSELVPAGPDHLVMVRECFV